MKRITDVRLQTHSLLVVLLVLAPIAVGQGQARLVGQTQDCFAGKQIHPAHIDIYLLDPQKLPEIASLLTDMEKLRTAGSGNESAFFASYRHLSATIRKAHTLGHVKSGDGGDFSFGGLRPMTKILLVGVSEREDDPAYYAYMQVVLAPGKNSVKLNFDQGEAASKPSRREIWSCPSNLLLSHSPPFRLLCKPFVPVLRAIS